MSLRSSDNVAPTSESNLSLNTGVAAPQESVKISEDPPVSATVLRSEAVDQTVADHKSQYADYFDARRLNSWFNGRNAVMYNRCGVKHDTDTGGWNLRWDLMQTCCPGYLDPIGFFDMPLVCVEKKSYYVPQLLALIGRADEAKRLMVLDACCLDLPYDQYYLIIDAEPRSREHDLELQYLHGPTRCLLRCHDTEVIVLPQRNRGSYYTSTPDMFNSY